MGRQRKDGRPGTDGIQRLVRDTDTGNLRATRKGETATRYKVWHRDDAGRLVGRTFETLADAKAHQRNIGGQRERGELVDNRAGRTTMDAMWHEVYDDRKLAGRTRRDLTGYWGKVPAAFRAMAVRDVRAAKVDAMLATFNGQVARTKVGGMVGMVLRHAKHDGLLAVVPWEPMRIRGTRAEVMARVGRKQHALTWDELRRLIDATPDLYKALIEFMGRVGVRPGEAYALTVGQFGPMCSTVTIDRSLSVDEDGRPMVGPTKTGKVRVVPLPADLAATMRDHIGRFSHPSPKDALVFPSMRGGEHVILAHNFNRRVFRPAVDAAGIEPPTFQMYDLRHTACSNALARGVSPVTVANMSGHTVQQLLSTYAHVLQDQARDAADALGAAWVAGPAPVDADVRQLG